MKLAPSYVQDKLQRDKEEAFQLEMLRDFNRLPEPGLMRVRVFSRFRDATKYQLWISYPPTDDNEVDDGRDNEELTHIQGYYCTCKSGVRKSLKYWICECLPVAVICISGDNHCLLIRAIGVPINQSKSSLQYVGSCSIVAILFRID